MIRQMPQKPRRVASEPARKAPGKAAVFEPIVPQPAYGRVAAAIENSRRPRTVDLRRLGIDPQAFTSIGLG